ncbi:MAG: FtsX-like permease family protein [Nitrospirae bacterium]|nr:FtsX-like permease family protein [Nitrospirota bacterium]
MRNWLQKNRYIVEFTLSSLLRRKGKNLALIVSYTFTIFLLSSVMLFTHAIKEEALTVLDNAPQMVIQKMIAGRHELIPVAYIERLRQIPGVSAVKGRLWGYFYDPATGSNFTLIAPDDFRYSDGEIVIGQGISRSRSVYKNDIMSLRTYSGSVMDFKIAASLSSDSELVSADLMLVSTGDFRRFFGIPDSFVTDIAIEAYNPRELNIVANKVTSIFPDTRPILRGDILRTYEAIFNWRGGVVVIVLTGTFFAFIIFAWDKATGLSADDRREIGVLKAVGWDTSDVLLMKFWEGAIISLTSYMVGVVFAYAHVFFLSSSLFEPFLKGWSVLYPRFRLMPALNANLLATLFFLTVLPYTVATILPSWRAATTDPDTVMR